VTPAATTTTTKHFTYQNMLFLLLKHENEEKNINKQLYFPFFQYT